MNISGINSLVFYKLKEKRILLLGERHSDEGKCKRTAKNIIDVSSYLSELTKKIPEEKCLDIFLEGSYKIFKKNIAVSGLVRTRNFFNHKEFKNLRIHHTDVRSLDISQFPLDVLFEEMREMDTSILSQFLLNLTEVILYGAIDYLLGISKRENRKYFIKVFSIFNLKKELFDFIESWEREYFGIVDKELKKLDKSLITRKKLVTNLSATYRHLVETNQKHSNIVILFGMLFAVPIDLYNLTRIFIKFDDKPRRICNNNLTVNNVIIYTGSTHTKIYKNFLNTTFNLEPEISKMNIKDDNLCLNIPKFDFWS